MNRLSIYTILAVTTCLICTGCGRNSSKQLGPAEVVESFTQAVASGNFEDATQLCNEAVASGYINTYRKALSKEAKADSTATSIATRIMSEVKVIVTEVSKGKGYRTVFYTIEDVYGDHKEKIATVKNEAGEWKVTEILDRN